MKKVYLGFLVLFLTILGITTEGYSIPAYPGKVDVKQKDGTTITIQTHGDEFFGYSTTSDGYVISSVDGVFYYADIALDGSMIPTKIKANNQNLRTKAERVALSARPVASSIAQISGIYSMKRANMTRSDKPQHVPTTGSDKFITILVDYKDVKFTSANANTNFTNMLNEVGYSANGGTGSARDYFMDNSGDLFTPEFVVVGPVTLPETRAFYGERKNGANDINSKQMIIDACTAAVANGTNFADYDIDGDGTIDNVFIYYAGHNEAEGGPSESIWPHKGSIGGEAAFSGKSLANYACTSELKGSGGSNMAGIGTFSHEFGHVLGLADTYDTVYTPGGSEGMFTIDLMTSGGYNNGGNTPPYYLAYERDQIGWMTTMPLTESGDYELKNIAHNEAYKVLTSVKDEVIYLEFHNGEDASITRNWNKAINGTYPGLKSEGLLITHIDKSANSAGGMTAKARWSNNQPNNFLEHECGKFIYSGGFQYLADIRSDANKTYFPGKNNVTTFGYATANPAKDWSGKDINVNIENIRIEGDVLKFTNNVDDYTFVVHSNAVEVSFKNLSEDWQMKWKKTSGADSEFIIASGIDFDQYYVYGLSPSTEYTIVFEKLEGTDYVQFATEEITTKALVGDFPTMFISINRERLFNAALNNFAGDYANVKWFIEDVEVVNDATIKMQSGKNSIICEITKDGVKDRIFQTLNVQ